MDAGRPSEALVTFWTKLQRCIEKYTNLHNRTRKLDVRVLETARNSVRMETFNCTVCAWSSWNESELRHYCPCTWTVSATAPESDVAGEREKYILSEIKDGRWLSSYGGLWAASLMGYGSVPLQCLLFFLLYLGILFDLKDGENLFLRNDGIILPDYTVSR